MDKENAKTKKKLKRIGSVREFDELLERSMISEEEKSILCKIYKEQKSLSYIADELGMSIATVKRKHHRILIKLGKLF